ncbi:TP901 family phage tail tape measure protein [Bacillus sp. 3255]|nr:TP901 family phage tail tape measure protein [Bacillus sp. 3255]
MSTIKALTGATTTQMAQMEELALNMGSKTKYSALQAAQGIEELLKAGLNPAAVSAGGLEAALNLATAGGLDLAEAAVTMSTALNAFRKDGMTAAEASNILAGTANAAATSVHEIGMGLASAGGVADMVGISFKDLNAAIGLMSSNGLLSGADAGTSFKTMLMYLQPQTDKAAKLFERLGFAVGNTNKFFSNGKLKDLAGVAGILQDTLSSMTEQNRTAVMLELFGTDGIKAATTLYKAGSKGVQDFYRDMGNVTALEVATERMNNGKGAIEQFKGALETLQIKVVQPLLPAIKSTFNAMGDYVANKTPQISAAMEKMTAAATKWVKDRFINNQEFRDMSIPAKVQFAFDSLREVFEQWYNSTGKAVVTEYMTKITDMMVMSLQNSLPQLIDIGTTLGGGIAKGMFDGLLKNWDKTTVFGMLAGKVGIDIKHPIDSLMNKINPPEPTQPFIGPPAPSGKAGGLDRVPYNGAVYALHKDERVQTKAEADEFRANRGGGYSGGPLVHVEHLEVRQESDIQAIAAELARELNAAMEAGVR